VTAVCAPIAQVAGNDFLLRLDLVRCVLLRSQYSQFQASVILVISPEKVSKENVDRWRHWRGSLGVGEGDTCGHIKPRSLQGIDNLGDRGSLDTIFVSQARNNDRCDR
jgi:hypothetical protein